MFLDVIIATHDRCTLLQTALSSLLEAPVPVGLQVTITVVDNNSTDQTAQVVQDFISRAGLPIRYLFEPRPGKAFAINTGISFTNGDLVGFIDDDERIDSSWYAHILEAFRDASIDFIGGPYIPQWAVPPPQWLPRQARGIIGWFEFTSSPKRYGKELPDAVLVGGNAVIRRSTLNQIGLYRTDLGSHDDQDMFERLLAGGFLGMYLPQLVIYHWIPQERLEKQYFRIWMWRAGPMYARMHERDDSIRKIFGIPLYLLKKMFRLLVKSGWRLVRFAHESSQFEAELDLIYSISSAYAYFRLRNVRFDCARNSPTVRHS
jgi:glycosyltransferase involved in cell wall biosynthesis